MDLSIGHIILQTVAMLITAFLIPRFQVHGPLSALIMVVVLGLVNTKLWDAALFYQIPNSVSAQTVVTLVVNGVLIWLLAKTLPGVSIQGFLPAIAAPIVLTAVSMGVYHYGKDIDWSKLWRTSQEQMNVLKGFAASGAIPGGARPGE